MRLHFSVLPSDGASVDVSAEVSTFVIAGWAGRDLAGIEHHIEELAALGVQRPSAVPLFYRVAENQLTQAAHIQVVNPDSSGEAETFLFSVDGDVLVSLTSDHTDRKQEANSVALSKQLCAKPVAQNAWRYRDVADHWDDLVIRSFIAENGADVLYQEGKLSVLRPPLDLFAAYLGGASTIPAGIAMSCGTVPAIGGIRPSARFTMELFDPVLNRTLRHGYAVEVLPEVA